MKNHQGNYRGTMMLLKRFYGFLDVIMAYMQQSRFMFYLIMQGIEVKVNIEMLLCTILSDSTTAPLNF